MNTYESGRKNSFGGSTNSYGNGAQYNDDAWSEDWDDSSSVTTVQPQV